MAYWLMKSEPDVFGIDDLANSSRKTTHWDGVRNFQARNFMRDQMSVGDGVLFYHSSCEVPGIAGIAEVASPAYPDETQFDPKSEYYDARSTRAAPRWFNVDVRAVRKTRLLPLGDLRTQKSLAGMRLLQPGNRLSITPVTAAQWRIITRLLG